MLFALLSYHSSVTTAEIQDIPFLIALFSQIRRSVTPEMG
jgi:hypothetical protein